MGLRKVFAVSIISGISLGFSYQITGELMGGTIGFVILNWFSQNLDSSIQVLVIIISLVISIVSIYGMSIFIRQVYEQRFFGIITASLGFSGSFLSLAGSQVSLHLSILGIGILAIGFILASKVNKKK